MTWLIKYIDPPLNVCGFFYYFYCRKFIIMRKTLFIVLGLLILGITTPLCLNAQVIVKGNKSWTKTKIPGDSYFNACRWKRSKSKGGTSS